MGKQRVEPHFNPLKMVAVQLDSKVSRPFGDLDLVKPGSGKMFLNEDSGLKIALGKFAIEVGVVCDLKHLERVLGLLGTPWCNLKKAGCS